LETTKRISSERYKCAASTLQLVLKEGGDYFSFTARLSSEALKLLGELNMWPLEPVGQSGLFLTHL